jgi:hypothetical protein
MDGRIVQQHRAGGPPRRITSVENLTQLYNEEPERERGVFALVHGKVGLALTGHCSDHRNLG